MIDNRKEFLEEISSQLQETRIEVEPVEEPLVSTKSRRLSRQFSSEREALPVSSGMVKSLSQKITLPLSTDAPSEKDEAQPLSSVRKASNFAELQQKFKKTPKFNTLDGALERSKSREGGLASVRQAENFNEKKAAFEVPKRPSLQKIALPEKKDEASVIPIEKKPTSITPPTEKKATTPTIARKEKEVSSTPVERTLSRQVSKEAVRKQPSMSEVKKTIPKADFKETDSVPVQIDVDIKSRIAAFSSTKRTLGEAEKVKRGEALATVPRRAIRDNSFLRGMKMQNKSYQGYRDLEGIGKDELDARKQRYKTQRLQKPELDGKSGLPRRNNSLFREIRKKRPSMSGSSYSTSYSVSSTEEEASEGTFEDYGSEYSNDGTGSAQDQSPSDLFKVRLCLPENTSASHYQEIFLKALKEGVEADHHILDLAGTQVKSTLSLLERIIHTQMRLSAQKAGPSTSDESETIDRVRPYAWKGQDTVDLVEQRLAPSGRIMFQVFHNGCFDGLLSDGDRIFECLPAAVGRTAALNEATRATYSSFTYNNDNNAVLIRDASEISTLVEWAEYESLLPTWTELKGEFEDGETVDFGQSFSIGVELPNRMIDPSADQLLDFFALQYKKVLLDAVYAEYDAAVLVLPPQFKMIKIAQEGIQMALIASEYYLPPTLTVHVPEVF